MKNTRGWMYLPVEVKVRELDAKLLLAFYAAKDGYTVIIGDHIMVELASEHYPEGLFFSKGYPRGFRKRVITSAKQNGHAVVELDEEGLLVKKQQYLRSRMKRDMLELVTHEYCWGRIQKEIIGGVNPDLAHKCHIVGNPRLDLLKPKYSKVYKNEVAQLEKKYGDFILINTRFSRYNSGRGMKDYAHFKHIKQLYYHFLEMIKVISKEFPATSFIIRPHPGERAQSYREFFSSYKNVHVVHEGNIVKWLLAAKGVIHNGCTSGIEAYLLKKPLISYVPFSTSEREINLPNELGSKVTHLKEIPPLLKEVLNDKPIPQNEGELYEYCQWSLEKYSYEAILDLCKTIQRPFSKNRGTSHTKRPLYIRDSKKRKRRFSLTELEIQGFFDQLNEIEGSPHNFSIKKVGENLYKVQGS